MRAEAVSAWAAGFFVLAFDAFWLVDWAVFLMAGALRGVLVLGAPVAAVHEAVEQFVQRTHDRPATIIVDPPRTGMSRDALSGAIALGPRRIIYVSCDVATLARDARRLVDAGFHVGRADAFDLFPNTPHVETVVVFDRSG